MPAEFDAIVIGTGQAGPSLARRMAAEGWTVAVLERDQPGGTCVNAGCIPTKTLVASAKVAAVARRTAQYGVALDGPVRIDMRHMKERMHAVSGASRAAVARALQSGPNIRFIRGHGRLAGPDSVELSGELLRARRILLNVGARAATPDVPGSERIPHLNNASFLALDEPPQHLIVVGGRYVDLEFRQLYRRFGSAVTRAVPGPARGRGHRHSPACTSRRSSARRCWASSRATR